jgi:NADPH:quinone reductase-like Zn-dependent oxidoreductase
MHAIVLDEYGPPSALKLREVPDPTPGPKELLVRVAGASVNPIDWKQRSGAAKARLPLHFPAILGKDAAGTVVALGDGATGFSIGDRVLGRVPAGGYAELVAAPVNSWARAPEKLDLADAGALPLVVLTGSELAYDAVDARGGETILVTGATGPVGRTALFAAKERGAKVIAGVRGKHRTEAERLGADAVVALDDDSELAKLPTLDGIADTVSGETIQKLYAKLKPGGKIGSVLGEPPGAKERGFVVRAFMTGPNPQRLLELAQAVADGKLVVPIAKRFRLAEAAAAHELAEHGINGKVLLVV